MCLGGPASWAQHQEPSLVDRLLRPNMDLQNIAQGKKFAAGAAVIEYRGSVGTFLLQPNRVEKSFVDTRVFPTAEFPSRSFNSGSQLSSPAQNRSVNTAMPLSTSSIRDLHDVHDAHNAIASRDFADQHQFREQGKSQKSLDRQNPPLTIEQVRELLNKNK